jgi:hypothetical protein
MDYRSQAQAIIDSALNDPAVYAEMARRESVHWGGAMAADSTGERAAQVEAEQRARLSPSRQPRDDGLPVMGHRARDCF